MLRQHRVEHKVVAAVLGVLQHGLHHGSDVAAAGGIEIGRIAGVAFLNQKAFVFRYFVGENLPPQVVKGKVVFFRAKLGLVVKGLHPLFVREGNFLKIQHELFILSPVPAV